VTVLFDSAPQLCKAASPTLFIRSDLHPLFIPLLRSFVRARSIHNRPDAALRIAGQEDMHLQKPIP